MFFSIKKPFIFSLDAGSHKDLFSLKIQRKKAISLKLSIEYTIPFYSNETIAFWEIITYLYC